MKILKIACITVAIFIFGFIAWIYLSLIFSSQNDYREAYIPVAKYRYLFSEQVLNQLESQQSYKNEDGSVMTSLLYNKQTRIIIWKLPSFNNLQVSDIQIKSSSIEKEDLVTYSNLKLRIYPFLELSKKLEVQEGKDLFLNTGSSRVISTRTDDELLHLTIQDLEEVSLGLDSNTDEAIIKSNHLISLSHLLILKRNGEFILFLLYPESPDAELSSDHIVELIKL